MRYSGSLLSGGRVGKIKGNLSFAAGERAKANHNGSFVWADSTDADFTSTAANQFAVRANDGAIITGTNYSAPMLSVTSLGSSDGLYSYSYSGTALKVETWNANNLIEAWEQLSSPPHELRFMVSRDGAVKADSGFSTPASDFAELLPASDSLEPGDVLVVGSDGRLTRSTEAYASAVVGVYSTKPGFVGGAGEDVDLTGEVPLALVGIVPVKATAENGAIQPGDLLTTSSTPGHAMKAGPNPAVGTIVGKAMERLDKGAGVIKMLVMLQ